MSETFSFIIAIVSLLVSCVSAVVPAILNHHNTRKEHQFRKTEMFFNNKFSAYRNLVDAYAKIRTIPNNTVSSEFLSALQVAACVSSGDLQTKLLSIYNKCAKIDYKLDVDISTDISACIKLVSSEYTAYITNYLQSEDCKTQNQE